MRDLLRRSRRLSALLIVAAGVLPATGAEALSAPVARAAATCSDYENQAAAQRAADTRDGDGDGRYCESLPCPCSSGTSEGAPARAPRPAPASQGCTRPSEVQPISFSKTKYRNIRAHYLAAIERGWPRVLVLNRPQAGRRRDRLLQGRATRSGFDRDEYPPAVGRGRGKGLTKGSDPRGWKAHVAYVDSSENRSHGSRLGIKLRRFCDDTRFRYVFY